MKILLVGDSFAADWTTKYPDQKGWPNLLADQHSVTNLAQAGCSEYRILQQLKSTNLSQYNVIIVSHTSPYRIYVKQHPVHKTDTLHHHSDLIYTDVKEHSKQNKKLLPLVDYFENYFDIEYAQFMHELLVKEIKSYTRQYRTIHITHTDNSEQLSFKEIFESHKGLINHYSDLGNQMVFSKILEQL